MDHDLARSVLECALPIETVILQTATVEEALSALRKRKINQKIIYFYAVDDAHKLKGVVSTRQLLLAEPTRKIEDIMLHAVIKIHAAQSMKEAMELFAAHPLLALPVVDKEGKLLGAIDVQMVMQEPINFSDERGRSDVFQMIGITLEEKKRPSLFQGFRHRMPWLLCNVFSGLCCAVISRVFELVLAKVLLLAFFIPLVLTLSESTSMQSMAQSLQFLRRPRFSWKSIQVRAYREWQLVVLLAITLGILVGALSLFWGDGILPSIAIGVGIITGVSFSAIFGIIVPIGLNRLKLDPKVASGPVVLMIVDILTTAIYLGIATWWLIH
ncbi:MAG TPA: magnesium transporter [Chlamydiales bacterium]|nr:magnesium transporter [Chlamydiales bacterium]